MTLESLYEGKNPQDYYLGRVTQVYRGCSIAQVENLSIVADRSRFDKSFLPNTINNFVVIESTLGVFLGEIFENKASRKSILDMQTGDGKNDYHEISIDTIALMTPESNKFELAGFQTLGISDKVYLATDEAYQLFITSLEFSSEKEDPLPTFATYLNKSQADVIIKPSTLFNRHIMCIGATNSGKSTTALAILDKVVSTKRKALIIDPTGEYRDAFSDDEITKLTLGVDTTISPSKISMEQWEKLFETENSSQGAVLSEAITSLRYMNKIGDPSSSYPKVGESIDEVQENMASVTKDDADFNISLLPEQIQNESVSEPDRDNNYNFKYRYDSLKANSNASLIQKIQYQMTNTKFLDFFSNSENMYNLLDVIDEFVKLPEVSLYIDTSALGASDGIGGMVIDLVSNYIISRDNICPFVFFIDEVHRYAKSRYSEKEFHGGLTLLAREGRKKGVFLYLTTQNPKDVSPILFGQIGTLLIHRLMLNDEINAVASHLDDYSIKHVRKLRQGEVILSSVNLLHNMFIHIKKSERTQHNATPHL